MPNLGVLGSNFEKLFSYLKLAPSNLSYCKVWGKIKSINLGPKVPDLGTFGLEFENNIEISVLESV